MHNVVFDQGGQADLAGLMTVMTLTHTLTFHFKLFNGAISLEANVPSKLGMPNQRPSQIVVLDDLAQSPDFWQPPDLWHAMSKMLLSPGIIASGSNCTSSI
jgi:hypothetical protein